MAEENQDQNKAVRRQRIITVAAIVLGLTIGLILGLITIGLIRGDLSFTSPEFSGVELLTPQPVEDFTLTAQSGEQVTLSDFRGHFSLIYFGYTYCPDVCPGTLAELARAMEMLDAAEKEQIQVIMVTVDPERDSPEALAEYLDHFDPSFLGLSGSEEAIAEAAGDIGVFIEKQPGSIESGYLVDHTASIFVVDPEGNLKHIFKFGTQGEDMAADLERLLSN